MPPDWTKVTIEHVRQACALHDFGTATPRRAAQSTFLIHDGKLYPAKFIRGMAYRLATGIELEPSRDYSGGLETIRFFERFGLTTRHGTTSKPESSTAIPAPTKAEESVGSIALVSHDYNVPDAAGRYDYSEHFARINRLCDDEGCDTILYALYTWDRDSMIPRNQDTFFGGLTHVNRIIFEVGLPALGTFDHVEVWMRGRQTPVLAHQRFATSSDTGQSKQQFLDDLSQRQLGDALLVLCGETNIASTIRGSDEFYDPYNFTDLLREMKVRLVLNPVHDYMRRYEMRVKRRHYSLGGRTVISVWNQGKGREAFLPWTVFHDGAELTDAVRELDQPFADRPDLRIGVLDLETLQELAIDPNA